MRLTLPVGFSGLGQEIGIGIGVPAAPVPVDESVTGGYVLGSYVDPSDICYSPSTGQAGPCGTLMHASGIHDAVPLPILTLGDAMLACRGATTAAPCHLVARYPCDPLITAGAGLSCSQGGYTATYWGPTGDPNNILAVDPETRQYLESQGIITAQGTPIANAPIPTSGPAAPTPAVPAAAQTFPLAEAAPTPDTGTEIIPGLPNVVTVGGGAALLFLLLK